MGYEGVAALAFDPLPLGGFAPFVDDAGVGTDGIVVEGGEGDPEVGVADGVADDGDGDWTVGVVGVPDDGDGEGDGDCTVPLLFEMEAAATVILSFMPREQ